jgi:SWI/SNF-related matrix-associated actin-dependent regulator 1 of chromatin subfamily A
VSRALGIVNRLRKLAVDQARRELAGRLAAEAAATATADAVHAALRHEHEAARAVRAEDAAGAAFAAWLPRGLQAISVARDASAQAQEAVAQGRAALAEALAAREAVSQLLAREAAARILEASRRDQAVLDEVGQRGQRVGRGR